MCCDHSDLQWTPVLHTSWGPFGKKPRKLVFSPCWTDLDRLLEGAEGTKLCVEDFLTKLSDLEGGGGRALIEEEILEVLSL